MNFVAIDFETANEKRNSPCSIGLVVIKDGQIMEKHHYYIRPMEMRFLPMNIGIHGIRPAMVEQEPEFDIIFRKIRHYFEKNLIIAHNAAFDLSVLRATAELYGLELPDFSYICTMKLAKNFYIDLDNAKLNTVSAFLGFDFLHHEALSDALACSNILLRIAEELQTDKIEEISDALGVTIGKVEAGTYQPSRKKGWAKVVSKRKACSQKSTRVCMDAHAYQDENVVFTGRLFSMTREEAMFFVRQHGGTTSGSVSKKTTMLVTNLKSAEPLRREEMSTKLRKATDLLAKGHPIRIVNEDEFLCAEWTTGK